MKKELKAHSPNNSKEMWAPLVLASMISLAIWVPHIDSFNVAKFALLCIGTFLLSIFSWTTMKSKVRVTTGLYLLVIFLIALFINVLTSPNTYKTIAGTQGRNNGALTYFCFAALAFIVASRFKSSDIPKLLWSLAALGLTQTLYTLAQLADLDPIKWNNPYGNILGTLGNPNFAAALLAMCSIASLWLIRMYREIKTIAIPLTFLIAMQLFVILKSNVRQSIIIFCFGLAIFVSSELSSRKKILSLVWGVSASFVGILSLFGTLRVGPLERFLYKESVAYRGDYWRAAWRMFTENPITGVGLGNYGDYFNRFRDATQVARRGPTVGTDAAHNVPLDFLAMGGITLGITYLSILIYCFYLVISRLRNVGNPAKQSSYIILSLLGSYVLQSIISIDQIGLAVWGWLFIGVALSLAKERQFVPRLDSVVTKCLLVVTVCITAVSFIFVSIPTWRSNTELKLLANVPNQSQGVDPRVVRLQIASKIEKVNPRDSDTKTQIALYLLTNGQAEGINYAKRAFRQNPSDSTALRYLIIAYGQLNDAKNLNKFKAEALKIDPFNPELK